MTENGKSPEDDVFYGLHDWAREVERQATRDHQRARTASALANPFRSVSRAIRRPATIAVLMVVVIVAVVGWTQRDNLFSTGPTPLAMPTNSHPTGVYATTTATAGPTDPFQDTPAGSFPFGAAGLTVPPAQATGGYDAQQVAAALDHVRKVLVAGRIDHRMLVDHDPSTLVALFAPDLADWVNQQFATASFGTFATQLAPGARLLADEPRVSGRTTYQAVDPGGKEQGYLQIVTNYVWVYALDGPNTAPGSRLAIVHDEVHWKFYPEGMNLGTSRAYTSNMDCGYHQQDLLALPRTRPLPTGSHEPWDQLFSPDHTLDVGRGCPDQSPTMSPTPNPSPSPSPKIVT